MEFFKFGQVHTKLLRQVSVGAAHSATSRLRGPLYGISASDQIARGDAEDRCIVAGAHNGSGVRVCMPLA